MTLNDMWVALLCHLGKTHVYTKLYSYQDISLEARNANLIMTLKVKSGDHQSQQLSLSENQKCLYKILCQSIQ